MKVDYVNPFLTAAYRVLEQEVKTTAARGDLTTQNTYYTTTDMTAMIGVTGDVEGVILLGLANQTARKLLEIWTGEPVPLIDRVAQSAIGELANMISGQAITLLEGAGFHCKISPPTLVIGRGALIATVPVRRVVVPLTGPFGSIQIGLALREGRGVASAGS